MSARKGRHHMTLNITQIEFAHQFTLSCEERVNIHKNGRASWGFIYCTEGQANFTFKIGSRYKTVRLKKHDVFLIPKGVPYTIRMIESCRHYTINFQIEESILSTPGCPAFLKEPFSQIRTDKETRFDYFFDTIASAWKYKPPFYMMQCMSYLYRIFFAFATEYNSLAPQPYNQPQIFKVANYIDEHWNENLTAEELAAMCNMGVSYFRHQFKKTFGLTPAEYRNDRVLKNAKEFLVSGYFTVAEVAQKCGFTDPNYFSRFFKKHTGYAPGKFMRQ